MFRREPAAIFGNADGNHFIFRFINRVQNGSGRKQRHFMLAAAPAKENANPKFCHDISVWRSACLPSIAALVPAASLTTKATRGHEGSLRRRNAIVNLRALCGGSTCADTCEQDTAIAGCATPAMYPQVDAAGR